MTEIEVRDVGLPELRAGLADGSILLVDVREDHEVAMGVIPGSLVMPLSRFAPDRLPVDEGRRIVFSCAAGVRSIFAIEKARSHGLELSEHFSGGYKGWVAEGEPVSQVKS